MRTGMDIKQDMMETNNMNPVAFMASSGKVITADDAEMMLKHSASYFHIQLYTADQIRKAQVEVLREARDRMAVTNELNPLVFLDRMADELEGSKT